MSLSLFVVVLVCRRCCSLSSFVVVVVVHRCLLSLFVVWLIVLSLTHPGWLLCTLICCLLFTFVCCLYIFVHSSCASSCNQLVVHCCQYCHRHRRRRRCLLSSSVLSLSLLFVVTGMSSFVVVVSCRWYFVVRRCLLFTLFIVIDIFVDVFDCRRWSLFVIVVDCCLADCYVPLYLIHPGWLLCTFG